MIYVGILEILPPRPARKRKLKLSKPNESRTRGGTEPDRRWRARGRVRIREKMAYLFPILRDEIHIQYIFQYLESQDAILTYLQRVAPAGEQNFEFSGARRSKSLVLGK